jgi:Glycosyl transferase family 2
LSEPERGALPAEADRVRATTRVGRPEQRPVGARTPSVTVVIPCFNYARFLPQSVQSALDQDDVVIDVVVVDDRSTDDSLAVANALAAADPRVQVVAHELNQGPVATFNHGLERVTGEYVIRLDADDLLTPGSVARAVALLERFPGVGMAYGHPLHFVGDELPPARTAADGWTIWPGTEWLWRRCALGVNCITSPEVVMRASVVAVVGGQKELAHTHDMEMWMRISAVSDVGHVDGADQAWHRDHEASRSAVDVDLLTELEERRDAFDVLFAGPEVALPDGDELRGLAHRALAVDALERACRAYDRNAVAERPVDELVRFALEVYPGAEELPQWRALRRRRRLGPAWSSKMPWFLLPALVRKVQVRRAYRVWERTGI